MGIVEFRHLPTAEKTCRVASSGHPRLLALRGGAIGDFLVTLPALRTLRNRWPDAYIELWGYPHVADLACEAGLVNCVCSLDRADAARLFSLRPDFSPAQAEHLRSFHVILSYLHDPSGTVCENLERLGAQQVLCGSPMVEDRHAVDQMFLPLASLALYPEGEEAPELTLPNTRERGRALLPDHGQPVLMLHPGSGSPAKNWPLKKFQALGEWAARARALQPVWLLGEADTALAGDLQSVRTPWPVRSGLDLGEVACALSACAGYVGNDSGISHLAAAVGVPTLALFGPSDPARWAPRGRCAMTLSARERSTNSLAQLSVQEAAQCLGKLLDSRIGAS